MLEASLARPRLGQRAARGGVEIVGARAALGNPVGARADIAGARRALDHEGAAHAAEELRIDRVVVAAGLGDEALVRAADHGDERRQIAAGPGVLHGVAEPELGGELLVNLGRVQRGAARARAPEAGETRGAADAIAVDAAPVELVELALDELELLLDEVDPPAPPAPAVPLLPSTITLPPQAGAAKAIAASDERPIASSKPRAKRR